MQSRTDFPTAQALAAVTLAQQHPLTRTWDTDDARLPRLAEEHQDDLDLATNMDTAQMRAEYFAFPERQPAEYLNRWQPVSGDLTALLSLRFEGLDRTRPFVDLSGTSRPWTAADLPALRRASLEVYGAFEPRYLRLFSAAEVDAFPALGRDKRFLVAPLAELASHPAVIPPELTLRPTADDRHLEQAAAAYAQLDRQHPAHARQAQVLDAELLQEMVEAQLIYDVRVGTPGPGTPGCCPTDIWAWTLTRCRSCCSRPSTGAGATGRT